MLVALPNVGSAGTAPRADDPILKTLSNIQQTIQPTLDRLLKPAAQQAPARPSLTAPTAAAPQQQRATAPRAATGSKGTPPMHGTGPHAQGTVLGASVSPPADRPTGSAPDGSQSGETVVVGRPVGSQASDGKYGGHVTIAALLGRELLGVDTKPGESKHGPLEFLQAGLLDPISQATNGNVDVTVLQADSTTTDKGSANVFKTAHVTLGSGEGALNLGVAESTGNISSDATSQTSHGDSVDATLSIGSQDITTIGQSASDSKASSNGTKAQKNTSKVITLFGRGISLPSGGCADGTVDDLGGIPMLLPTVCNADDQAQAPEPSGTRESLTVFALDSGGMSVDLTRASSPEQLLKAATAASESSAVAPSQGGPGTPDTPGGPGGPGDDDDDGGQAPPSDDDGPSDRGPSDDSPNAPGVDQPGGGQPQCSDSADNDGDGKVDAGDPGCLSGPNGSYNPNDDSEASVGTRESGASLPRTGSDVLVIAIGGLALLGLGGLLRRRIRGAGA